MDVLVNSASIYPKSRLGLPEDLIENPSVNAYGPLVLSRALAPRAGRDASSTFWTAA
ncbi:hypothetical protein HS125_03715 [bacterium]|nr:hypothetical protein [bacterium]